MTTCPKCNGRMTGPRYSPAFARGCHEVPHEALVYTCSTCGYQESGPTADQKHVTIDFAAGPHILRSTAGRIG